MTLWCLTKNSILIARKSIDAYDRKDIDMTDFKERIKKFEHLLSASKNTVFFGGAGVSTESGIPDFRSKDGLYNQHDVQFDKYEPEYLLSYSCLRDNPKVFFEFYNQKMNCANVEPNITHKKLAELEKAGKLSAIITQNIDGLHQKAGSKNVIEIHGTTQTGYCVNCGQSCWGEMLFSESCDIPLCTCGGMLRPDVVLYEENLPQDAWNKAIEAVNNAELFIIGGTSLSVYPARDLVFYTRCPIVVINRDETEADSYADIVFHENLGTVFGCL